VTDRRLDRVFIFRDQLSFLIPHEWIESEEDGENYLYHTPGATSGWLRVSLISIKPAAPSKEELEKLLAERAEKEGGVLYRAGENIIAAWEQPSEEHEIPIINYWWAVGYCHGPHLSHEAMFSYTILQEKRDDFETKEMLTLLLELIAATQFAEQKIT